MTLSSPSIGRRPGSARWVILALGSAIGAAIAVAIVGPVVAVAVVLVLLAFAGMVSAPGVVLAAYLLIAFYKGALQGYSPIDLTVLLAVANIAQALPVILDSRRRAVSRVGVVLWLTLGLLVIGGVLYAPGQSLAFEKAIAYWALTILPILPAAMRVGSEPRYVNQFLWTFFGMGIVTVVLGLVQWTSSDRLQVLDMNTIQVARGALLVPLIGITFVLPQQRSVASVVTLVLIPFSLLVAIASGSRGPLVVLVVIGLIGAVSYLMRPRKVRWRLVGGVLGLALVTSIVISAAAAELPSLALGRFASFAEFVQGSASGDTGVPGVDASAGDRIRLFGFALDMFEERPLIGAGTAGFETLSMIAMGRAGDTYPHNSILQVAAEYGLLGLTLFLGVVALSLIRPLPGRYTALAMRTLFLFVLLNSMVSGDIFTDRDVLGILLLILVIDAPSKVVSQASEPVAEGPTTIGAAGDEPAPRAAPPWSPPIPGDRHRLGRSRSAVPQQWI